MSPLNIWTWACSEKVVGAKGRHPPSSDTYQHNNSQLFWGKKVFFELTVWCLTIPGYLFCKFCLSDARRAKKQEDQWMLLVYPTILFPATPESRYSEQRKGKEEGTRWLMNTLQYIVTLKCSHRAHRVAMATTEYTQSGNGHHRVHTEWQWPLSGLHSIMMEKSAQPVEGGGCTPTPFTLSTITNKVVMYAPAEKADTLPNIYSTLICTLWL
jgi:hypothetical protein